MFWQKIRKDKEDEIKFSNEDKINKIKTYFQIKHVQKNEISSG